MVRAWVCGQVRPDSIGVGAHQKRGRAPQIRTGLWDQSTLAAVLDLDLGCMRLCLDVQLAGMDWGYTDAHVCHHMPRYGQTCRAYSLQSMLVELGVCLQAYQAQVRGPWVSEEVHHVCTVYHRADTRAMCTAPASV